MKNPIEWAELTYKKHGWLHALLVSSKGKNETTGWDGSGKNTSGAFWLNAFNWLKKRAPAEEISEFQRHTTTAPIAK